MRGWSEDTVLSSDVSSAGDPAIAADSAGNIYVAWITSGLLRLRKRLATGEWLPADTLQIQPRDNAVSLAIDHCGNRHLVWARYGMGYYGRVCYVRHSGTGWEPD
ncbi:MAG: hypothetical protein ABIK44_03730, partial [candidate division WOR-3 bacterium]